MDQARIEGDIFRRSSLSDDQNFEYNNVIGRPLPLSHHNNDPVVSSSFSMLFLTPPPIANAAKNAVRNDTMHIPVT